MSTESRVRTFAVPLSSCPFDRSQRSWQPTLFGVRGSRPEPFQVFQVFGTTQNPKPHEHVIWFRTDPCWVRFHGLAHPARKGPARSRDPAHSSQVKSDSNQTLLYSVYCSVFACPRNDDFKGRCNAGFACNRSSYLHIYIYLQYIYMLHVLFWT